MVVPMEQWAGQPFQDKSADLWVVMLSDHNEKYSDRMERSYKAFAVTFELRFPFPLKKPIINLLAPGRFECKLTLVIGYWGTCISCEIAPSWISLDLTNDK